MTEISVDSVSKSYWDRDSTVPVLRNVSLETKDHTLSCLSGPSGSGKTTLLNIISGLDHPDSGEVRLDGVRLLALRENEIAKLRASTFGIVFQNSNLVGHLTALENIVFPTFFLTSNGRSFTDRKTKAMFLLSRLSLNNKAQKFPSKLSEGERRRVAIARALVVDPKVVVADEPTMNLDAENVRKVIDLFREVKEQGAAVLLSTHDANVARSCDEIFEISYGKVTRSSA